jgi:hypothetical protein
MAATHGDEGDQAYRAIRRRLDATAERFGLGKHNDMVKVSAKISTLCPKATQPAWGTFFNCAEVFGEHRYECRSMVARMLSVTGLRQRAPNC